MEYYLCYLNLFIRKLEVGITLSIIQLIKLKLKVLDSLLFYN